MEPAEPLSATQGRIINGSWFATAIFAVTALPSALDVEVFHLPAAIVALVLFAIGIVAMLVAIVIAANRSREDLIGIGGLFFGAGSVVKPVRRQLLGSLAVQVVLGFVFASLRPFTASAFGTLVPVIGLGLTGVFCAKYGVFHKRTDTQRR